MSKAILMERTDRGAVVYVMHPEKDDHALASVEFRTDIESRAAQGIFAFALGSADIGQVVKDFFEQLEELFPNEVAEIQEIKEIKEEVESNQDILEDKYLAGLFLSAMSFALGLRQERLIS